MQDFRNKVTYEELIYWSSYLQLKSEREKAEYDRIGKESKLKRHNQMADAIYEVNIKLDAQQFEQELNQLKGKLKKFEKEA